MFPGKIAQALLIVLGSLVIPQSARELSFAAETSEFATARLVSAVPGAGSLQQIPLGLHPTRPEGVVLPKLLTVAAVIDALETAGRTR